MAATDGPYPATPTRYPEGVVLPSCPGRAGATVVFWVLVLMGLSTFAPCVLVPQWRQYQALCLAEQTAEHRLDLLRSRVEKERRLLEALRSDPAVVARLAQRDLGFRRPYEQVIRVAVPANPAEPPTMPVSPRCSATLGGSPGCSAASCGWHARPVQPPPMIARALSYLPNYNYDRIFCEDDTRPILMGLSVALIVAAFGLFNRRWTK